MMLEKFPYIDNDACALCIETRNMKQLPSSDCCRIVWKIKFHNYFNWGGKFLAQCRGWKKIFCFTLLHNFWSPRAPTTSLLLATLVVFKNFIVCKNFAVLKLSIGVYKFLYPPSRTFLLFYVFSNYGNAREKKNSV